MKDGEVKAVCTIGKRAVCVMLEGDREIHISVYVSPDGTYRIGGTVFTSIAGDFVCEVTR